MNSENSSSRSLLRSIALPFKRFFSSEYAYLTLAFLIPALIMYLVYVAMSIRPFGDGSVLVLDMNAQYVYFFEALRNALEVALPVVALMMALVCLSILLINELE